LVIDAYDEFSSISDDFYTKKTEWNQAKNNSKAIFGEYHEKIKTAFVMTLKGEKYQKTIQNTIANLKLVDLELDYDPKVQSPVSILDLAFHIDKKGREEEKTAWPATLWNDIITQKNKLKEHLHRVGQDEQLNLDFKQALGDIKDLYNHYRFGASAEDQDLASIRDPILTMEKINKIGNTLTINENLTNDGAEFLKKILTLVEAAQKKPNWYKDSIKKYGDKLLTETSKRITNHTDAVKRDVLPVIGEMKSNEFTAPFKGVQTKFQEYLIKIRELKDAKDVFENSKPKIAPAQTKFLDAIKGKIEEISESEEKGDGSELASETLKRLKRKLTDARNGKQNKFLALNELLVDAFKVTLTADTTKIENSIKESFLSLFQGYPNLIGMDKSILQSLLSSAKISWLAASHSSKGQDEIPKIFKAKLKDKAMSEGKKVETIHLALTEALKEPDIAFLFGTGSVNASLVSAFKKELYNKFNYRLDQAVKAEKEAAYDYWWLTFYPKAIPLGDRKLEGESIIEVSFPKSVVTETQYHRWLQDQRLTKTDVVSAVGEREVDSSEDKKFGHKIRLATSVINDFLIVLDSSNLTSRYPRIRSVLLQALQCFSGGECAHKFNFDQSDSIKNSSNNSPSPVEKELKRLAEMNKNSSNPMIMNYLKGVSFLFQKTLNWNFKRKEDDYQFYFGDREEPYKEFSKAFELDNINKFVNKISIACQLKLKGICLPSSLADQIKVVTIDLMEYQKAFAAENFDIGHVLFTVLVASETNVSLPQKVELYTNAFFNGIGRYVSFNERPDYINLKFDLDPDQLGFFEENIFRGVFKRELSGVIIGRNSKEMNELREFLSLKGIDSKDLLDLGEMNTIYRKIKKIQVKEIESSEIEKLKLMFRKASLGGKFLFLAELKSNYKERVVCEQPVLDAKKKKGCKAFLKLIEKKDLTPRGYFRFYSEMPKEVRNVINKLFFKELHFTKSFKDVRYIGEPDLWFWEWDLSQTQNRLRNLIVNNYHTNYPGVPDPRVIKEEFLGNVNNLRAIIYQWLRDLWVSNNPFTGFKQSEKEDFVKTSMQHLLDQHPYLTLDTQAFLIQSYNKSSSVYDWMNKIYRKQSVMDQLRKNLLNHLYASLFSSLDKLGKVERQKIPYVDIGRSDFDRFKTHWSKSKIQKGIQIVDLLPASRDDLISMSVNEGGVVFNLAAQAEAAAAYDLNQLQMAIRNIDLLQQTLQSSNKDSKTETEEKQEENNSLSESLAERLNATRNRSFNDFSDLSQAAESLGYRAGASGKGSIFARANSAMAYSRRKEYLDAAITAAGRGDNFAKWVVRKSDLRSELSTNDNQEKFVAASHSGFPNGDQPFNMLVKIPYSSVHRDWDGSEYVLFNSSYMASKRFNTRKKLGNIIPLLQGVVWLVHPDLWEKFETEGVGTVYPFKWDARNSEEQEKLLKEPNILGGRVELDDTDKIRYSEILTLIKAEENFIKLTRKAQSSHLQSTLQGLRTDSPGARKKIREEMIGEMNSINSLQEEQRKRTRAIEKQQGILESFTFESNDAAPTQ